jgi:hypothetical protein
VWSFISPPLIQNVYRQADEDGLLLHPRAMSTGGAIDNNLSVAASSPKHPPPFLTVALMKLTKALPKYCKLLAEPSFSKASLACEVLDCVVATASPAHSPKGGKTSASSHPVVPSSPLTLQYWMSSSSSTSADKKQSPTSSAMALEGEWENFVSPFLLLAGAQVLSAGLEHLRTPTKAKKDKTSTTTSSLSPAASLTGLYQRVNQDLLRTQEVLCEPFLRPSSVNQQQLSPPSVTNVQHHYAEAAASLASSIQLLVIAVNVRCQLVDLQAALYGVGGGTASATAAEGDAVPSLTEAAAAVTLFLQTITTTLSTASIGTSGEKKTEDENDNLSERKEMTDPFAVEPIISNLIQELKAFKYCFETCVALERCL